MYPLFSTNKIRLFNNRKGYEMMKIIEIDDQFITLNQLLKLTNEFESGGAIKIYIRTEGVLVNGELDFRRGRKLFHNDYVTLKHNDVTYVIKEKGKPIQ